MTTDYATSTGCAKTYLKAISDAGFSHIHWCHQWNTDFVYARCEIEQIRKWLAGYGLELLDLHGSMGPEKNWVSGHRYERLAGVELVKNRIDMAARLSGNVVIMHTGDAGQLPQLHRSLDEIHPFAAERGVRIALENCRDFKTIRKICSEYGPDYIGLCYDSGHGNMQPDGLAQLESMKDRLISVHLHDNDGTEDQHKIPFFGTVDWQALVRIIAGSSYRKCISLEAAMRNSCMKDETEFLACAHTVAVKLTEMLKNVSVHGNGMARR